MKICSRPHCAIRSHHHTLQKLETFAQKLKYPPKFCDISTRCPINDKDLIDDYNFLLDDSNYCKSSESRSCGGIFLKMLNFIEKELDLDLRKLLILYLFTMLNTPFGRKLKASRLDAEYAITEAYNRALLSEDNIFVNQMIINYRM